MKEEIYLPIKDIHNLNTKKAESGILSIFQTLAERYGFQQAGISYQTPRDDSLCLQKLNDQTWEIFYFERGHKHDQKILSSVLEGCFEILDRVILNQQTLSAIKDVFTTTVLFQKNKLGIHLPNRITKYLATNDLQRYGNIKLIEKENIH